jgi:glycosyltransferase involved in cell wall biosynthesis
MNNYILWIGSLYEENHLKDNKATSPAANYWQLNLLNSLRYNKEKVILLSNHFQRIFPFGYLFPNGVNFWKKGFKVISYIYINIPILKSFSIFIAGKYKLKSYIKNNGFPKCIITYNPTIENSQLAYHFQTKYEIPWIDLCADAYDPGENWLNYNNLAKKANGHIFLSYYAFKNSPFKYNLHLDGGIDIFDNQLDLTNKSNSKVILYTGMLCEYGGLDLLINSFLAINDHNLKLIICGHGKKSKILDDAIHNDKRITFLGLVPDNILNKLYSEADIFINPRPIDINGGSMNFPSKILKYLSFGKPVISSKTFGLSPDYEEVLIYFEEYSIYCLSHKILEILSWTDIQKQDYFDKVNYFIKNKKNWIKSGYDLSNWLKIFYA